MVLQLLQRRLQQRSHVLNLGLPALLSPLTVALGPVFGRADTTKPLERARAANFIPSRSRRRASKGAPVEGNRICRARRATRDHQRERQAARHVRTGCVRRRSRSRWSSALHVGHHFALLPWVRVICAHRRQRISRASCP
jgi:hypothetical protein